MCERTFEPSDKKHHCRACGDGFCEECSDLTRPVPERGWGETPVRVCKKCYDKGCIFKFSLSSQTFLMIHSIFPAEGAQYASENKEVTVRKIGEVVQSTLGTVASAIDYPLGVIIDLFEYKQKYLFIYFSRMDQRKCQT